ncbi:MAG: hypothetical protein C5B51_13215 [Terriglobia bacterium]|nr:MAG: hypothetical protein C5B51_13215 [Terriglobia bacterium]
MGTLWSDLRFAVRMLRKSPAFTVVALLAAALGIGANVALFSIVNVVLIRALPFPGADRLYTIVETHPQLPKVDVAYQDFLDWKARSHVFDRMAVFSRFVSTYVLNEQGQPEELHAIAVAPDFFPLLGATPLLGQTFTEAEDREGANHYALLSESLWRRRFRSDPAVVGRSIHLSGDLYIVTGVLPEAYSYPPATDLWVPLTNVGSANRENRMYHAASVIARLRPGATREQAQQELTAIARRLETEHPRSNRTIGAFVEPLREQYAGNVRTPLLIIFSAMGLVLLIACANIAGLLLARATGRQTEISIRTALGASRGRLLRQFLAESMLLGVLGGLMGILFARWLIPLLTALLADTGAAPMPGLAGLAFDPGVLAFAAAVSVATGLLFGILPALNVSRLNLNESLKQKHSRASGVLVAGEMALAVVVLVGTGLLLRSFERLLQVDPGIRTDHLLTAQINLAGAGYSDQTAVNRFYERLLGRLRQLPGVTGAATVNSMPLRPLGNLTRFAIGGQPLPEPGRFPVAQIRPVSPGYFETMGMRLIAGRLFRDADLSDPNKSYFVINESLARRYFGSRDPVGQNILMGVTGPQLNPVPVIGVVGDAKDLGVDTPAEPELYLPGYAPGEFVMIRTEADPLSLASAVRREARAIDPEQTVASFETMEHVLAASLARRRLSALLLACFSLVALALATIGIFGIVSYAASQRTRELGVRIALGALPGHLLRLLARQGLGPACAGLIIGLAASFLLTRLMETQLYGISPRDAVTFTIAPLVLLAAALLAVYLPARRALRLDPMTALRSE